MTNNYTEQIASLLSGNLEIHKISQEIIQIMLDEYPYSPYGHLVNYLKAKSQNRENTQELLHKLATYSPDRAWLQQVLNTNFSDIEASESTDQAIPSEAKDPNLDKFLFEFDFNQPIEPLVDAIQIIEEAPVESINASYQEAEIEVTETLIFEEETQEIQEASGSYISWLKKFQSDDEERQADNKVELTEQDLRSTEVIAPIIEKTTRKDNDLFGGIITETLAELLANQGQTEKAISMYERLSLIFPNKSAFFAAKIEQLKHNIT